MRFTAEVRWFWPGSPPAPFEDWFINAGPQWPAAGRAENRIDTYLSDRAQTALGIKRRGGAEGVEVKGLICCRGIELEIGGCRARVELWGKWTSVALSIEDAPIIRVTKRRRMRRFRIGRAAVTEIGENYQERQAGCDAELTRIEALQGSWWSFGKS